MRHSFRIFLLVAIAAGVSTGFWACGDEEDSPVGSQDDSLRKGKKKPRACGARLGDTCKADEFCDWTLEGICGFADATGVCKPKPEACTEQYEPVCGCDGQTYGNACAANSEGISVQSLGSCAGDDAGAGNVDGSTPPAGKICGGIAGIPCAAGQFCNLEPDAGGLGCGVADGTGVCEAIPTVCTRIYAPVCGCDGVTYSNECEAHGKGVSVASQGECGGTKPPRPDAGAARSCGGLTGAQCGRGEFCNFAGDPSGVACGAADGTGVCQRIPDACTAQYDPVCGCDDKTYGNACTAHAAGVSIASKGECKNTQPPPSGGAGSTCGGLQGLQCTRGLFCNFENDPSGVACGAADGTGICEAIPGGCTLEYNPVCGCDDKTYGNACAAHSAGVSVASKGECAGQAGPISCDPRKILCKRAPPKCPGGTVPSVVGTCYGDCVPAEKCPCSEAAECPLPDEYTCHRSRMHCGPYVN